MIHPSYNELMKVVNNNAEYGEEPVVNSRYSIVIASVHARSSVVQSRWFQMLPAKNLYLSL